MNRLSGAINALALLLTLVGVLCGAGVALRFQSSASGVLAMIPTFVALFLTPCSSSAGC